MKIRVKSEDGFELSTNCRQLKMPQRMAIEWKHVDVALFDKLPRNDKNTCVVVEAKKMSASCLSAVSQALSYAKNKSSCRRLIVTDGLRYGVHVRNGQQPFTLGAYMNLTRLRKEYPIDNCSGANEALLAMASEWKPDIIHEEISDSR